MVLLLLPKSTSLLIFREPRIIGVGYTDIARLAVILVERELTFSEFVTNTIRIYAVLILVRFVRMLVGFGPLKALKLLRDLLRTKEGKTELRSRQTSHDI
jgi:hypothetical protein